VADRHILLDATGSGSHLGRDIDEQVGRFYRGRRVGGPPGPGALHPPGGPNTAGRRVGQSTAKSADSWARSQARRTCQGVCAEGAGDSNPSLLERGRSAAKQGERQSHEAEHQDGTDQKPELPAASHGSCRSGQPRACSRLLGASVFPVNTPATAPAVPWSRELGRRSSLCRKQWRAIEELSGTPVSLTGR
jgi:hypothetical protein